MFDIPSISAIVAATSVAAGVIYYSFQIRHQTKMRRTDLVIRLYATFITKEFQEAYEKVATIETHDYNDTLKEGYLPRLRTIGGFFEGMEFFYTENL